MIVLDNQYLYIEVQPEQELLIYRWKSASESLDQSAFFAEGARVLNAIVSHKCKYVVGNVQEFKVIIAPETQETINEQLLSVLNQVGLKKLAQIVNPDNLLTNVSLEQTLEENKNASYQQKFFDNEADALAWVKE